MVSLSYIKVVRAYGAPAMEALVEISHRFAVGLAFLLLS